MSLISALSQSLASPIASRMRSARLSFSRGSAIVSLRAQIISMHSPPVVAPLPAAGARPRTRGCLDRTPVADQLSYGDAGGKRHRCGDDRLAFGEHRGIIEDIGNIG